jgi:3-oxoacyl-[acyl-carrier protein] reductase
MTDLTGEVAVVTGASRGIGAAVARSLADHGATVVGTATTEGGARRVEQMLADARCPGKGLVLDVADAGSVDAGFASLADRGLLPGILVNNAGITRDTLFVRMSDEQWDAVIDTDLTSLYRTCKACVRHLMKRRGGRIINVTSVVGFTGNAGQANYAAAKAGIVGFTRALAKELGGRAITVNAVAPGFVDTDMTRELEPEQRTRILAQVPLGRLGAPEEIADAVAFLASPSAGYITGETLHVNGGMYMG